MLNVPGGTPQGTSPASARQLPPEAERPGTRAELQAWIRQHLNLPQKVETELNAVIDHVITRQERLWQASKDEAIKALLAGFAERMAALRLEIVGLREALPPAAALQRQAVRLDVQQAVEDE